MRRAQGPIAGIALLAIAITGCTEETICEVGCEAQTTIRMDPASDDFFSSPFPSDARRGPDGRPDIAGFPNPSAIVLVDRVLDVIRADAKGFGVSSGVFFEATAALDATSLPSLEDSVKDGASVFLVGIDPSAPDYLERYPVEVTVREDASLYGSAHLVSILPLQGVPLRPGARYAAVVTSAVRDAAGAPLVSSSTMKQIAAGTKPDALGDDVFASYTSALDALAEAGVDATSVVGMTVYTTDDPTATMQTAIEAALRSHVPSPHDDFVKTEDFPTYCVYEGTIDMPVFQAGEPPYLDEGGGWVLDDAGEPVLDHAETARFVLSIPKQPMPSGGYPIVVLSRTGAGGDRPLVDRGAHAVAHGEPIEPGTGPALEYARAGFAGASVDGPHGGLRNITHADEQFLVFNFQNPLALRDNVRQSALELALMPSILVSMQLDVSDCAGADTGGGPATFDDGTMAIMGHSMGAAIAPLALVYEPRYRAALLSGAGGSFLENMVYKEQPLAVKPLAELILGMTSAHETLATDDPILSMLQWAGEPADNPLYARYAIREPITGEPRHVLMMQGIVDHYIMPPIANATSLAFGLDLAGEELDAKAPELSGLHPLGELLPLAGRGVVSLPVSGNAASEDGRPATAIVTQNAEDGIEDGHEVVFQTEPPKHAYACFLAGLKSGAAAGAPPPTVPSAGRVGDACE